MSGYNYSNNQRDLRNSTNKSVDLLSELNNSSDIDVINISNSNVLDKISFLSKEIQKLEENEKTTNEHILLDKEYENKKNIFLTQAILIEQLAIQNAEMKSYFSHVDLIDTKNNIDEVTISKEIENRIKFLKV